jgi:threonylcarbamoyladenosine tRNA methylthiotransferase CDKAL1
MKFYLEKYGCTLNQAQGEMIASSLISQGNSLVDDLNEADSVLISTCIVIDHTEKKMLKRIDEFKKMGKDVLVSGCLTHYKLTNVKNISFEVSRGNLPLIKPNDLSVGIPIAEGCDGGCSFCISRLARGRLKSFSREEILNTIEGAVQKGAKEVRLTALDTGSYGYDIGSNLPELLKDIKNMKGDFTVRIGMMEPEHFVEIQEELLDVMKDKRFYKFLHLPFQSGDPMILKKMGRKYRIEDFVEGVKKFREKFPDSMLSTDVIVGFPYENVQSLIKTKEVILATEPEILNITKYSPRPGTVAYNWKTPPTNQTATWSQIFSELHREISERRMRRYVGREMESLVIERGKDNSFIARDEFYHPIILRDAELGQKVRVKIINSTPFYLIGENGQE